MLFFDIGSNIGKWSLANLDACDKIISVEASPTTFARLVEHCKSDKVTLLNYAVCNNGGKDVQFYESTMDTLSTLNKDWLTKSTSRFYNQSSYKQITCKTISIDKLIEQYGTPNLIKIDVEGGEYDCVSSLTKKVDLLCFEWASETVDIALRCIDHLSALGFAEYYIQAEDNYVFRPNSKDFYNSSTAKSKLSKTTPKVDWGMIWCK